MPGKPEALPIFLSDVKARQGELTADGLQLTASVGYGIRNTPERVAVSRKPTADSYIVLSLAGGAEASRAR